MSLSKLLYFSVIGPILAAQKSKNFVVDRSLMFGAEPILENLAAQKCKDFVVDRSQMFETEPIVEDPLLAEDTGKNCF